MPASQPAPRVLAEALEGFLDGEPWTFTLTINDPATDEPMDLTGSHLFVRFTAPDGAAVGICDSSAGDGSLIIAPGTGGEATFQVLAEGRTWRAPRPAFGGFGIVPVPVVGDLYRSIGASAPQGVCRLRLPILASTGT